MIYIAFAPGPQRRVRVRTRGPRRYGNAEPAVASARNAARECKRTLGRPARGVSRRPGRAQNVCTWGGGETRASLREPRAPPLSERAAAIASVIRPSDGRGPGTVPEAAMCVQDVDVQCVLQFTLVHAAGCALHRRASRVIHRSEVCIFLFPASARPAPSEVERALSQSLFETVV